MKYNKKNINTIQKNFTYKKKTKKLIYKSVSGHFLDILKMSNF